jgi:hypothetical protein
MPFLYPVIAIILVAIISWMLSTRMPTAGNIKPLVNIVLSLILIGIVLWLINTYIPMAGSIKAILNIVVVIATCVFVLKAFGLWGDVIGFWRNLMEKAHRPS